MHGLRSNKTISRWSSDKRRRFSPFLTPVADEVHSLSDQCMYSFTACLCCSSNTRIHHDGNSYVSYQSSRSLKVVFFMRAILFCFVSLNLTLGTAICGWSKAPSFHFNHTFKFSITAVLSMQICYLGPAAIFFLIYSYIFRRTSRVSIGSMKHRLYIRWDM